MDASPLFPHGYHPVMNIFLPDMKDYAHPLSRYLVPVRYYFVDFGISTRFLPENNPRLVTGTFGLEQHVPELSLTKPYDPFKVDIFLIGNLIQTEVLSVSLSSAIADILINVAIICLDVYQCRVSSVSHHIHDIEESSRSPRRCGSQVVAEDQTSNLPIASSLETPTTERNA